MGSAISSSALAQARSRRGDVALQVLRLPGEAFAHGVPHDLSPKRSSASRSAGCHAPLMNCTTPTRLPRPSIRSAGRTRRSTCPCRGRCGRSAGPSRSSCRRPRRPAPPCASPSWRGGARPRCRRRSCSWLSLHDQRQPGDQQHDAVGARRDPLVEPALQIAKPPRLRIVRHDARADFVATPELPAPGARPARFEALRFRVDVSASANMRLVSHSVRQSTSTAAERARLAIAPARSTRRIDGLPCPPRRPRCSAMRARHLVVDWLRGRDIDPRRRRRHDDRFGVAALAGAGAAEHQGQLRALGCQMNDSKSLEARGCGPAGAYTEPEKEPTALALTKPRSGHLLAWN